MSYCSCEQNILLDYLFSLTPEQFTLLSTLLGMVLANNLSLNEQEVLGEFFSNLGQSISTLAAQGELLESRCEHKREY